MKTLNISLVAFFVSIAGSAWSADTPAMTAQVPPVNISTAPISAGQYISPGVYTATIAPTLNMEMAGRLKKAFAQVPGIKGADASSTDSTVRFTVKEGSKIRVADLQALVAKTNAGAVMTAPIAANSMTPKPGL